MATDFIIAEAKRKGAIGPTEGQMGSVMGEKSIKTRVMWFLLLITVKDDTPDKRAAGENRYGYLRYHN